MQHPHGYSAARAVYDALELRFAVYDLIDRTTLVTCMRLHKGGMLAVAKCLYGEVHITRMQGMNRKSLFHQIYLDSVRILDRSCDKPRPDEFQLEPPSIRFSAGSALRQLATLRRRFPSLRSVLYQETAHDSDDAFDIHIIGDTIHIHLESRLTTDIFFPPPLSATGRRNFPTTPNYPGVVLHHTISLRVENQIGKGDETASRETEWRSWLYGDVRLDARVRELRLATALTPDFANITTLLGRLSATFEHNVLELHIVITDAHYGVPGPIHIQPVPVLLQADPDLRRIDIRMPGHIFFGRGSARTQDVLDILDAQVPTLEHLSIHPDPKSAYKFRCIDTVWADRQSPRAYAPRLRSLVSFAFTLHNHYIDAQLVELLSWVGKDACVYYDGISHLAGALNVAVRTVKAELRG